MQLSRYHYRCPLCLKTIGDMTVFNHTVDAHLRQVQGPIQAALGHHVNTISLILCNDCELRCVYTYALKPIHARAQVYMRACAKLIICAIFTIDRANA